MLTRIWRLNLESVRSMPWFITDVCFTCRKWDSITHVINIIYFWFMGWNTPLVFITKGGKSGPIIGRPAFMSELGCVPEPYIPPLIIAVLAASQHICDDIKEVTLKIIHCQCWYCLFGWKPRSSWALEEGKGPQLAHRKIILSIFFCS